MDAQIFSITPTQSSPGHRVRFIGRHPRIAEAHRPAVPAYAGVIGACAGNTERHAWVIEACASIIGAHAGAVEGRAGIIPAHAGIIGGCAGIVENH